jgi:hypothetical protein
MIRADRQPKRRGHRVNPADVAKLIEAVKRPPTWFEWLTVVALLLGPILALMSQRALDRIREKQQQRLRVYFTLMSTRASHLAPAHVQALNQIDVLFNRDKDAPIREAWRTLFRHIETKPTAPGWHERLADLKADLYLVMGKAVGYTFTLDYLKRGIYSPQFYMDTELDQVRIRQAVVKVLEDDAVKVRIVT